MFALQMQPLRFSAEAQALLSKFRMPNFNIRILHKAILKPMLLYIGVSRSRLSFTLCRRFFVESLQASRNGEASAKGNRACWHVVVVQLDRYHAFYMEVESSNGNDRAAQCWRRRLPHTILWMTTVSPLTSAAFNLYYVSQPRLAWQAWQGLTYMCFKPLKIVVLTSISGIIRMISLIRLCYKLRAYNSKIYAVPPRADLGVNLKRNLRRCEIIIFDGLNAWTRNG